MLSFLVNVAVYVIVFSSSSSSSSGASTWLSVLPLIKHDFLLHKSAFRDALCLRYGWLPPRLADICPCGKNS